MDATRFSPTELDDYHRDGFVIVRQLFAADETELLLNHARGDESLRAASYGRKDASGMETRLALWNRATDDLYSLFVRSARIVDRMEQMLGDEVYLYHHKMMLKEPLVGGAWEWHQDYGYWYQNGVLWPDLVSVFIAVDPATRENGCLQVLSGSHRCGRVDHVLTGDQAGADAERVAEIAKRLPLVHVEMEPGDALFFHPNLLHRSDQNRSESPRWSLICCYNARRNDPYKESHHPRYTPLAKVEDAAILEAAQKRFADAGDVGWLDPGRDASARGLGDEKTG